MSWPDGVTSAVTVSALGCIILPEDTGLLRSTHVRDRDSSRVPKKLVVAETGRRSLVRININNKLA